MQTAAIGIVLGVTGFLAASMNVVPAAEPAEALADCLAIEADQLRLRCYDTLATRQVKPARPDDRRPATEVGKGDAQSNARNVRDTPGESDQADTALFGLEHRAHETGVDTITAHVVGGFAGWSGRSRFELDNGQVWEQSGSERFRYHGPDRPISINRGALGSFRLSPEGLNRSVRVRRVE